MTHGLEAFCSDVLPTLCLVKTDCSSKTADAKRSSARKLSSAFRVCRTFVRKKILCLLREQYSKKVLCRKRNLSSLRAKFVGHGKMPAGLKGMCC